MKKIEWPTLGVALLCYGCWALSTTTLVEFSLPLAIVLCGLSVTLHSSLQHEVIHGHPFRIQFLSDALVFPALGILVPFNRFRDLHIAHHKDSTLTDPYDDPESQYLDPVIWQVLPPWIKMLLNLNRSLLGRMIIGPLISFWVMLKSDFALYRKGDSAILPAYLLHAVSVLIVLLWVWSAQMPIWAYLLAAYFGNAILRIRIFIEHRADEHVAGRTVIIEDRGPLAFLFLNNNFHAVHHIKPGVPWYDLPKLYFENRTNFLERNRGYSYPSYRVVIAQFLFNPKEPVAHPYYK